MQDRYVKDLAILLGVVALIVLSFVVAWAYHKEEPITLNSSFIHEGVDDQLIQRIHEIDESIGERKRFSFRVTRDPLKQDLIVQTRMDLLAQWEEMVRRMMRLTSLIEDNLGNKIAIIEYQGTQHNVKVGESLASRRFTNIDIANSRAYFSQDGMTSYLTVEGVPARPAEIDPNRNDHRDQYNW